MPIRHLGNAAKNASNLPRRRGLLTMTFPAASTAWTCMTFLARSSPTVVTVSSLLIDLRMDGFRVDAVSDNDRHLGATDAGTGAVHPITVTPAWTPTLRIASRTFSYVDIATSSQR